MTKRQQHKVDGHAGIYRRHSGACSPDDKGKCRVRRGDGSTYRVTWLDRAGRRRSATAGTLKEATARQATERERARAGEIVIRRDSIRVATFVEDVFRPYLDDMVALRKAHPNTTAGLKETTVDGLGNALAHILAHLGERELQSVDAGDITRLCTSLSNLARGKGQAVSGSTAHAVYLACRKLFGYAQKLHYISRNPANDVDTREIPHPSREQIEVWNREERARFVTGIEGSNLEVPVKLALATGLRRGEQAALRWTDFDLDQGIIHVSRSRTSVRDRVVETTPKSATSRRRVSVSPEVVTMLKTHRRSFPFSEYAFVDLLGDPVNPKHWSRDFYTAARKLGMPKASRERPTLVANWHALRHCHAQALLEAGVPLEVVSRRLGHASFNITHTIYQHWSKERDAEAAAVAVY
jgi:integrase